jgi:ribosomal protein L40E
MSSFALARQAPYPVRVQQRRCGKCGKLVSRSAYACRRCGKTQRVRPKTLLLCLAGGLMVGMFAVAGLGGLMPSAHPTEGVASAAGLPAARSPSPSLTTSEITAADLWAAYSHDAPAADRAYREHSLTVTGMVRSIDRNYEGGIVIRLSTGDPFETVNATLASRNDPALAGVAKGRTASLLCVGRGALMGAPLLGGCFLR